MEKKRREEKIKIFNLSSGRKVRYHLSDGKDGRGEIHFER